MKQLIGMVVGIIISCVAGLNPVVAETGHYVNGVEGIKAATVPPPGFYYRLYAASYTSDQLLNEDGEDLNIGFDVNVLAFVNRLIWVSKTKILGADFGMDAVFPLIYTDISIDAAGIDENKFGLGDIFIEPFLLAWHGNTFDAAFGIGTYIPTGDYDKDNPASPGKDFWTMMITFGSTWYFDTEKTWSASILGRYEIHFDKNDTDVKPGNDFHFEWGIGKTIANVWDIGIAGYCHWQVTDDSGSDVVWDKGIHDRVYAIGPEIGAFFPSAGMILSLRSVWEFEAKDRSEGSITTLTFTKFF